MIRSLGDLRSRSALSAIAALGLELPATGEVTPALGHARERPSSLSASRTVGDEQFGVGPIASVVDVDGEPVMFEVLVSLEYTDGSGPFTGFVSLVWPRARGAGDGSGHVAAGSSGRRS